MEPSIVSAPNPPEYHNRAFWTLYVLIHPQLKGIHGPGKSRSTDNSRPNVTELSSDGDDSREAAPMPL
jgi:hypothetical protein